MRSQVTRRLVVAVVSPSFKRVAPLFIIRHLNLQTQIGKQWDSEIGFDDESCQKKNYVKHFCLNHHLSAKVEPDWLNAY